jgi:hypothetical protein
VAENGLSNGSSRHSRRLDETGYSRSWAAEWTRHDRRYVIWCDLGGVVIALRSSRTKKKKLR